MYARERVGGERERSNGMKLIEHANHRLFHTHHRFGSLRSNRSLLFRWFFFFRLSMDQLSRKKTDARWCTVYTQLKCNDLPRSKKLPSNCWTTSFFSSSFGPFTNSSRTQEFATMKQKWKNSTKWNIHCNVFTVILLLPGVRIDCTSFRFVDGLFIVVFENRLLHTHLGFKYKALFFSDAVVVVVVHHKTRIPKFT